MSLRNIKAVIFDVDGVVFETHDLATGNYLWSKNAKRDLGLSSAHFKEIFSDEWGRIIKGKINFEDHLKYIFATSVFNDISISYKKLLKYWLKNDHNINRDILQLIDAIKIPCYLGTNQEQIRTAHILKYVGEHFQGCFASYKIGAAKPEKEFFEYIEQDLSLSPEELLLIDDKKENVEAAQRYGWHAYQYKGDVRALANLLSNYNKVNQ